MRLSYLALYGAINYFEPLIIPSRMHVDPNKEYILHALNSVFTSVEVTNANIEILKWNVTSIREEYYWIPILCT